MKKMRIKIKEFFLTLLVIGITLLCAVGNLTAQSFESLKRPQSASFNQTLKEFLDNDDINGLSKYLIANPEMANAASSNVSRDGYSNRAIISTVPLLYDAVKRVLEGKNSPEICAVILEANSNLNCVYESKTPIYIILDYIATHPIDQCNVAEQLLYMFLRRPDFDVNYRYQSLLPPLAYLIRTNRLFLGRFDKNYISDQTLKFLIEKGSPINTYDNDGNSLLNFAIETDNQFLSSYFIENGIDIMKANQSGNDAMYLAINEGKLEIIKQLLQQGYNLNINNLKNDPVSIRLHSETYEYLTEYISGKIESYGDIMLFINKFKDKFELVQSQLYAIYVSDFQPLEASRNAIVGQLQQNSNIESIMAALLKNKDFFNTIRSFINKHASYDPDGKIKLAWELIDIYAMCEKLKQIPPLTPEGQNIMRIRMKAAIFPDSEKPQFLAELKKEEYDDINQYIIIETKEIFFAQGDGLSFWDYLLSSSKDLENYNIFVFARVRNDGKLPKRVKATVNLTSTTDISMRFLFLTHSSSNSTTYKDEWYMDIYPGEAQVIVGYFKFQRQFRSEGNIIGGWGDETYIGDDAYRINFEYYDADFPSGRIQQQSDLIATLRKNGNVEIKNGYVSVYYESRAERWELEGSNAARKKREEAVQRCLNCEIDWDKFKLPTEKQILLLTIEKPGQIVMKNGDIHNYYYHNENGLKVNGFFWDDKYKTWDDMEDRFLRDCISKHCGDDKIKEEAERRKQNADNK